MNKAPSNKDNAESHPEKKTQVIATQDEVTQQMNNFLS